MKNKVKVFSLSALCLAILISILRMISLATSYNTSIGYFEDSAIVSFMRILWFVSAISCVGALVLIPKGTVACIARPHPVCRAAEFAAVPCFFICGLSLAIGASGLVLIIGIIMMASTLYFISEQMDTSLANRSRGALALLPLLCLMLILFDVYFDQFVTMNSPHKNAIQCALLSGLAFLLCEIRIHIGKEAPRAALASRLLLVITGLPTVLGNMVFYGVIPHDRFADFVTTPLYSIPLLALTLYAASRLLLYKNADEEETEKENFKNFQETLDKDDET